MAARIAVVGGGILGALTAYRLAHAGAHGSDGGFTISLFERSLFGQGASLWSAGAHFPFGRTAGVRAMSDVSQVYYSRTPPFDTCPAIQALPMRVCTDHPATTTQPAFTQTLTPASGADPVLARVLRGREPAYVHACEHANRADVHGVTQAAIAAASQATEQRAGVAVTQVEETASTVDLALSDGSRERFDCVILAPGPWSLSAPFAEITAHLGLRIKRVAALHIRDAHIDHDAPLIFFPDADAFLLPRPALSMWLFSYANAIWDVDPDHPGPTLGADDLDQGRAVLARLAPALVPDICGGRAFCDTYSPDRTPCVQRIGASGRLIYAGAANGSGYRLAPAMAEAAVSELARALEDRNPVAEE
jgi:glycine/D-amino acid oxidase-like deaminating enzyme